MAKDPDPKTALDQIGDVVDTRVHIHQSSGRVSSKKDSLAQEQVVQIKNKCCRERKCHGG